MIRRSTARRRFLAAVPAMVLTGSHTQSSARAPAFTLYTFGDSILDCGRYNTFGVHPGQLLVRNDDALFPEFAGRDLQSRGPARLEHRARDGATVAGLPSQAKGVKPGGESVALLTIGGNDLLTGLAADSGPKVKAFETSLNEFLRNLPIRPVLLGNVYDPTFGDDAKNFLSVDARVARRNHRRVNDIIASLAGRYGRVVDLHAHFLAGNPSWFTRTIEPSLIGASEVRRVFLQALER
jgi:lysophospholipase L1-like esterase